jgi:small-conductance mechanosensitive channel
VSVAVTFYDVVVWLHVTSVVVGFGATFAFGIYMALAIGKHPRSVPAVLEAQTVISRTLVTIGGVLILATGIYLTADRWDFGDFFVAWGIVAIIALLGLVHGFFLPHDRRALAAARRDIDRAAGDRVELGEEFNRESAASARMGPIAGLIIVVTIYVMVAKPFL